jgi:hypothetical protein
MISNRESIIALAKRAPKAHKAMIIQHGFNLENGTIENFIDYCERTETSTLITHGAKDHHNALSDSSDDSDNSDKGYKRVTHEKVQKKQKTFKKNEQRPRNLQKQEYYYCKYHKANSTHDSVDCKVLNGLKADRDKAARRNNVRGEARDIKYKKKYKEMHLLQVTADNEKAKYKRAYKKLKNVSNNDAKPKNDGSNSPSDSSDDDPNDAGTPYAMPRQGNAKIHRNMMDMSDSSDSNSKSDSDSDSNSE